MSDQDTCFVCRKHKDLEFVPGGAIYEDEIVFSGHSWSAEDQQTPYMGGFIVEPKRHIPTWAEMNDEEAERVGVVIRDVSRALKAIVDVEHVYVFVLGHHVAHLHVWVVPRYPGTPREYWGLDVFEWPNRPMGGQMEVEVLCEKMRSFME